MGIQTISSAECASLVLKWTNHIKNLTVPVPLVMPPVREISHEINLIDLDLKPSYHLPKCPDALREELIQKIDWYTAAGWWKRANVPSAAPMICVYKKDRHLRTAASVMTIPLRMSLRSLIKTRSAMTWLEQSFGRNLICPMRMKKYA